MAVCLLLCLIFFPAGSASSGASFQAKTTYTRDSAVFLKQGILLLQKKRFAEAREKFLQAVQADSDSAEAFFYLSIAERDLGHLSAAESDLRRSLDLNPNSQNALYNLGVLLLESKKPVEAVNFLERAEKIGPASPEISANLVRAYLEAGREDEALRFAESSARQFGHLPAFDLAIGKTFLSRNLLKSARIFLGRAQQLLPSEPGILFPLAEVCLRQKDVTCVHQTLSHIPGNAQNTGTYHDLLAREYLLSGENFSAFQEIKRAAQLEPQNPAYLLLLGRLYQKFGRQQEALKILEKAEHLAPNSPDIFYSMAITYFIAGDFQTASHYARRVLQTAPRDDKALFLLGLCHFAVGKFQEAQMQLSDAVQREPGNKFYQTFYGMLLLSENEPLEARAHLEKAVELDPQYALPRYQLGRLCIRIGKYREASEELRKAVASEPDLTGAYYLLAHAYEHLGEKEKAQQALADFKKYHAAEYNERKELLRQMQNTMEQ
jgi:Flp pilus assembly protein TadD